MGRPANGTLYIHVTATVFTALHGMQSRYSDGNSSVRPSVCLSVRPSVCQTRVL